MSIDPYGLCPGGTGKKVKFCCPDLVGELDKISRMLEGDQPQACLDHIANLEKRFADRACLTALKASLQSALGQVDAAKQTVEQLLKSQPDNPIALAEQALVVSERDLVGAVTILQRALSASKGQIMPQVYNAIGELAHRMLRDGQYHAARAHFMLQARLNSNDAMPVRALIQLGSSRDVPLLFKDDLRFWPAPEDAPWRAEFDAAVHLAHGVSWLDALERFERLSQRAPDSPAVWHNLATLRGWLGDETGMLAALRKVSSFEAPRQLPIEDAVECEALAILIDPVFLGDTVDEVVLSYPITDLEKLASHLAGDRHLKSVPVETVRSDPDQPPPRSAYWLLDKPVPESGKNLTLDQAPAVLATLAIFGRETDRKERLEVELFRTDHGRATELLFSICGDSIGASDGEQVIGRVQASQMVLSWHWRLPDDTPTEVTESLIAQQRRTTVLNRWPKTPQAVLGGKTPDEVARDPAQRIRLMAVTLLLELALDHSTATSMVNELRGRLGLPILGTIDPTTAKVSELPLVRLGRLAFDKLSDEDLLNVYHRSSMANANIALRKSAQEVVNRPSLDDKQPKEGPYGILARLEEDPDRACALLAKARESAEAANRPGVRWALDELVLRMRRGQAAEAGELLRHIQGRYGHDQNVRVALLQILHAFGLVGPDGRPTAALSEAQFAHAPHAPSILPTEAPAAQPGKLWTPGGETVGPGKKPAIWTPGS